MNSHSLEGSQKMTLQFFFDLQFCIDYTGADAIVQMFGGRAKT